MPTVDLHYNVTVYSNGQYRIDDPTGLLLHEGIEPTEKLAEKAARDWVKSDKAHRKAALKATAKDRKPKEFTIPY